MNFCVCRKGIIMTDLKTKLYQMFILGTDGDGYKEALRKGLGGIIFLQRYSNSSAI